MAQRRQLGALLHEIVHAVSDEVLDEELTEQQVLPPSSGLFQYWGAAEYLFRRADRLSPNNQRKYS